MTGSSTNQPGGNQNVPPTPEKENRVNGGHHGLGSVANSCKSLNQFTEERIMSNAFDSDNNDPTIPATHITEPPESRGELDSVSNAGSWIPFPVERLPEPIRSLVTEGAAAIGCDPVYIALACLVVCAAAIGNTRRLRIKATWYACHVIWGVFVGESGTMKTPAFQLAIGPIERLQKQQLASFEADQAAYSADDERFKLELNQWKAGECVGDPPKRPQQPTLQRCIVKNATVEKLVPILKGNWRGVLLALDELSGWFGSFNRYAGKGDLGADEAFWLSSYNCQLAIVDRKTGVPQTLFVPDAAVSVVGGIQPGVLSRALNANNREAGMAARLLIVSPPRKPKQWSDREVARRTLDAWADTIDRLMALPPDTDSNGESKPAVVEIAPDALQLFVDFYNQHNREQVNLTGDMAAAWSKLEEYAARIALVLHMIQRTEDDPMNPSSNRLPASTMADAIAITQWFKAEARRVYAILDCGAMNQEDSNLIAIVSKMGGECTVRELMQKHRTQYTSAESAEAVLTRLVTHEKGEWKVRHPEGGGRPSNVFVLYKQTQTHN